MLYLKIALRPQQPGGTATGAAAPSVRCELSVADTSAWCMSKLALVVFAPLLWFGSLDCTASGSPEASPKVTPQASVPGANFQLVCSSTDTDQSSNLFCVRNDTRNGDVKRIAVEHLPVSAGATASAEAQPGTYSLSCHATRSKERSDLYCVRLNTSTGDLMLIALPKVEVLPEGVSSHEHDGSGTHSH
jgi:hypothetical protein